MITLLLHAFYSTGIAFAASWMFGGLTPVIAGVSLIIGWWWGARHARWIATQSPSLRMTEFTKGEAGAVEMLLAIVIFYACLRHFAWLLFTSDARLYTYSMNNFGDLPLHINYIRSIANGITFPIPNPSFASETLRYPFGPDLYNALWESLGVPLTTHLFVVGVVASACALMVLRWFGGWWTMGAFFFSGGLAGLTKTPGIDPQTTVDWKNFLLTVFITQRGILFALPAGLLLIESWRKHVSGEAVANRRTLYVLGLVWGLLPLFHAHAFFIVSIILLGYSMIERGVVAGAKALFTSRAFIVAFLPALYFVARTTDGFKKASVSSWDPFWTSTFAEAPKFLVVNFGPWLLLPFAILIAIRFPSGDKRKLRLRLALAFGLFALFFNWMLAPWAWDNVKILMWPYLMIAQLANETIEPKLPRFSRYGVAFILFASGFAAVSASLGPPTARGLVIYQMRDLNYAEGALKDLPKDAVFLAAPTHEHPLTYFGRLRVLGYEGHLWSHGINSSAITAKADSVMRGDADWIASMREIGADYIYWGIPEKTKYGEGERPWMKELTNVSRVPEIAIYHLPSVQGDQR